MRWHTMQGRTTALPEVLGRMDAGVKQALDPTPLDASYGIRVSHDYTYGLSRESLRPDVPDEAYSVLAAYTQRASTPYGMR